MIATTVDSLDGTVALTVAHAAHALAVLESHHQGTGPEIRAACCALHEVVDELDVLHRDIRALSGADPGDPRSRPDSG